VTEVFGLSALIASTPEGTTPQFALYSLLYDMIQVVRGVVATEADKPRGEISPENLVDDVRREPIARSVVPGHGATLDPFRGEGAAARVNRRSSEPVRGVWRDRWRKPPQRKKPPPHQKAREWTHGSGFRIMEAHREEESLKQAVSRTVVRC